MLYIFFSYSSMKPSPSKRFFQKNSYIKLPQIFYNLSVFLNDGEKTWHMKWKFQFLRLIKLRITVSVWENRLIWPPSGGYAPLGRPDKLVFPKPWALWHFLWASWEQFLALSKREQANYTISFQIALYMMSLRYRSAVLTI